MWDTFNSVCFAFYKQKCLCTYTWHINGQKGTQCSVSLYSDYVMGAGHTQSCIYMYDQHQSCFVTHISQQTYFHLHIVFRFCRVGSYPTYLTNLGTAPGCYSSDL